MLKRSCPSSPPYEVLSAAPLSGLLVSMKGKRLYGWACNPNPASGQKMGHACVIFRKDPPNSRYAALSVMVAVTEIHPGQHRILVVYRRPTAIIRATGGM
jgi:hypothetical protein